MFHGVPSYGNLFYTHVKGITRRPILIWDHGALLTFQEWNISGWLTKLCQSCFKAVTEGWTCIVINLGLNVKKYLSISFSQDSDKLQVIDSIKSKITKQKAQRLTMHNDCARFSRLYIYFIMWMKTTYGLWLFNLDDCHL